jgi:hypothetical protein
LVTGRDREGERRGIRSHTAKRGRVPWARCARRVYRGLRCVRWARLHPGLRRTCLAGPRAGRRKTVSREGGPSRSKRKAEGQRERRKGLTRRRTKSDQEEPGGRPKEEENEPDALTRSQTKGTRKMRRTVGPGCGFWLIVATGGAETDSGVRVLGFRMGGKWFRLLGLRGFPEICGWR